MCTSQLYHLVVIATCFNVACCQRRIVKLNYTTVDKRFMVYLIQSNQSYPKYNAWLCGGALVRTNKVLTSAACLIESSNIYVIAGYKTYVRTADLEKDNCTQTVKRKVIRTCVPNGYNFDPSNASSWMTLDIGVAVVDRPYRSTEIIFKLLCDYIPKSIPILYYKGVTFTNLDVVAYGWGFSRGRRPGDPGDYNSDLLKYAPLRLAELDVCKTNYPDMDKVIDKYMLCTKNPGVLDDNGRTIVFSNYAYSCRRKYGDSRKHCSPDNETDTRRQVIYYPKTGNTWGICQNDHGGPLVAYIGVTEMLIGVAVNTIYDTSYRCVGPSLFMSTACVSKIIKCMLSTNPNTRRAYEQVIKKDGIGIQWRDIVWADELAVRDTPGTDMDSTPEESTPHFNETTEELARNSTL